MSTNAAVITVSSGKAVELRGSNGIFSCLMEHKVTETKATFKYTGPKLSAKVWAQVMEFFEWTYQTEKSEAQVRLFVHPEHGWAAWAFPQEGGTSMTSKELPMDTPEATEQRRAFSVENGWLYWGTVHHHCSAGAFASGTDDMNEQSQEGIHITVGHMDKAMRDIHCRMYIKGHKFEPMMDHFWELDAVVLEKAQEFHDMFGVWADLNQMARKAMCQNSDALYASLTPPAIPAAGEILFPAAWKANYRVRVYQGYVGGQQNIAYQGGLGTTSSRIGGEHWCHRCDKWTDHITPNCPELRQGSMTKKELRKLRHGNRKNKVPMLKDEDKTVSKAATLLDDLETQAACMGIGPETFYEMVGALAEGNNGALMECIVENMLKEQVTADNLLTVILEREIKEEMTEKESDRKAVQEQISHANGGQGISHDGYYGSYGD